MRSWRKQIILLSLCSPLPSSSSAKLSLGCSNTFSLNYCYSKQKPVSNYECPLNIFLAQSSKISLRMCNLVVFIARSAKQSLVVILAFLGEGSLLSTKWSQV